MLCGGSLKKKEGGDGVNISKEKVYRTKKVGVKEEYGRGERM